MSRGSASVRPTRGPRSRAPNASVSRASAIARVTGSLPVHWHFHRLPKSALVGPPCSDDSGCALSARALGGRLTVDRADTRQSVRVTESSEKRATYSASSSKHALSFGYVVRMLVARLVIRTRIARCPGIEARHAIAKLRVSRNAAPYPSPVEKCGDASLSISALASIGPLSIRAYKSETDR